MCKIVKKVEWNECAEKFRWVKRIKAQNCLTDYSVFPSLSDILVWGSPSQRYQTQKDENWCHNFSSVVYKTNLRTSRRKFHVWIEKKAFLPPPRFPGAPSPMENPSRAYAAALFRRVRKCGDRGTFFNSRIKDNRWRFDLEKTIASIIFFIVSRKSNTYQKCTYCRIRPFLIYVSLFSLVRVSISYLRTLLT